jgi:hypothetical protein
MFDKRKIAIIAAITAATAIGVAQITVPDNFEKPVTYRISGFVMKLISLGV